MDTKVARLIPCELAGSIHQAFGLKNRFGAVSHIRTSKMRAISHVVADVCVLATGSMLIL